MRGHSQHRAMRVRKGRTNADLRYGQGRNNGAKQPNPLPPIVEAESDLGASRRQLSAVRSVRQPEDSLDGLLSEAILSQDKELRQILSELDAISETLKSEFPDKQAMSKVLRRAVLVAVRQSLLDRELRSLALTDDLTGLYNRRAFLAIAAQQLKFAKRKQQAMLLFFGDLDHLKDINDSYGHREGDIALIHAADALEQTFRNSDVVARIGGDEFAVLALDASYQDEESLKKRLEKSLVACSSDEARYGLSLSVGVARFDAAKPKSLAELMAQADRAMYEEKRRHPRFWASQPRYGVDEVTRRGDGSH